jgi:hypothetical protein
MIQVVCVYIYNCIYQLEFVKNESLLYSNLARILKSDIMKNFTLVLVTGIFTFFFLPAGAQNRALNFDGVNDKIIVPPVSQYDFEYGTVEAWVRPQGLTGNSCIIGNRSFGGTRFSFHMSTTKIGMYNGNVYSTVNYTTTAGIWYHLAFVCSPTETKVYVNGNLIGNTGNVIMGYTYNNGEWEGITGQEISIGCVRESATPYEFFKGEIDDIRMYDYTRTQAEIDADKNVKLNGTEDGLVALFKFDQGIAGGNNAAITSLTEIVSLNNGFLSNFALSGATSNWVSSFPTLPVKLYGFRVSKQNNTALLQWNTAGEYNSQSFSIEHTSDGSNFTSIGTVAAARNSNTDKSYNFTDVSPANGNNYYRLKQVDVDGNFAYSEIKALSFSAASKLSWQAAGKNIKVKLPGGANESFTITDMNGRMVMQGRLENGSIQVTLKQVSIYTVSVQTKSGAETIKVSVQ